MYLKYLKKTSAGYIYLSVITIYNDNNNIVQILINYLI